MRTVGQATSQAFLAEAARCDPAGLHRQFVRTAGLFFVVGLSWVLPLLLAAPWLFALVFGPDWRAAGEMVQILMPLQLARFVVMPVSQVLNVVHRHDVDLVLSVVIILAMAASFAAGAILGLSPLTTIGLYSATSTLAFVLLFLIAWRTVRTAREARGCSAVTAHAEERGMYLYIVGRPHSGSTILDILLGNGREVQGIGQLVSGMGKPDDLCACGCAIADCPFWRAVPGGGRGDRHQLGRGDRGQHGAGARQDVPAHLACRGRRPRDAAAGRDHGGHRTSDRGGLG